MEKKIKDRIMIVYRDRAIIDSIIKILGNDEYDYLTVSSPIEALSQISFKMPKLIISEKNLEYDSGAEFCSKIRKSIKTKLLPFIIIADSDNERDKINAIEKGADAYLTHPIQKDELRAYVKRKLNHYNDFYFLSITDELTGLFKRKEFIKNFDFLVQENKERTISIIMIDLDFFKKVNDKHGHQVGDLVLIKFAEILLKNSNAKFFPSRFGGEEFSILMNDTNKEEAKLKIDEIAKEFQSINFYGSNEKTFNVTFSAGIAEYPTTSIDISGLMSRADQALYSAKKDGRNRCYIFNSYMAHNDRFWEYFENNQNLFHDQDTNDSVTRLPYLPKILEQITEIGDKTNSIGFILIDTLPLIPIPEYYGIKNYEYSIQNIKCVIDKTCNSLYASDIYIAIYKYLGYGFIILFPSLFDFTLNSEKCDELYQEICDQIIKNSKNLPFHITSTYSTIYYKKEEPKEVYIELSRMTSQLDTIRHNTADIFKKYDIENKEIIRNIEYFFSINTIKKVGSLEQIYSLFEVREDKKPFCDLDYFLNASITNEEELIKTIKYLYNKSEEELFIPYIQKFNFDYFYEILEKVTSLKKKICIIFNENYLRKYGDSLFKNKERKYNNFRYGISSFYISRDSLKIITNYEIDIAFFSEYLFKNLEHNKERIKLINGMIMFFDQLGIESVALNIEKESEYNFLKGMNISYFSGTYQPSPENSEY